MLDYHHFFRLSRLARLGALAVPPLVALACGTTNENGDNAGGSGGSSAGGVPSGGNASGAQGNGGGPESSAGGTSAGGGQSPSSGGAPDGGLGGEPSSGGDPAVGGASDGGSGGTPPGEDGFFGDSRCNAANLLLCDGFEESTIDAGLWSVGKSSQNTLELTTETAARGSQSVHIVAENGYAFITNESIFPVTNNDLYGRMFLRVKRFSTVDWAHWTVAEAAGTTNSSKIRVGGQYIRTNFDANTWANRWGVGSDGGETGDWTRADADPEGNVEEPATEEWVCLEWQHLGSMNETRFYLDGVEHPSLGTTAQDHGGDSGEYILPETTSFWFGWVQYQEDPEPFDIWIDEVALDDERIGCDL